MLKQRKTEFRCLRFLTGILLLWMCMLLQVCPVSAADETDSVQKTEAEKWGNVRRTVSLEQGAFTFEGYLSKDKKEFWIEKVVVNPSKGNVKKLAFPEKIGDAAVTRISSESSADAEGGDDMGNIFGDNAEPYHNVDGYISSMKGIQSLIIPDSVTEIGMASFSGMRDLKQAKLSAETSVLPYGTFFNCQKLKTVTLPAKLKELNSSAFEKCKVLEELVISDESEYMTVQDGLLLSKDKSELHWVTPTKKTVKIPRSVKIVHSYALDGSQAKKLTIGRKVSVLEADALTCSSLKSVSLDKKNKTFSKKGMCIYRKKGGALAVAIAKNGNLKINSKIKSIPDAVSLCGYGKRLKRVDIGASVKKLESTWMKILEGDYRLKIYFHSKKPPKIVVTDDSIGSIPMYYKVYVPKKSLKAYKKWGKKYSGISTASKSWRGF